MADIFAIIPARSGSKGVPEKNFRLLAGFELIAYSIAASFLSKRINRVIVSTDSERIATIAKGYGAEVPFLRPLEFAGDTSPDHEFVIHALEWLKKYECQTPDYLVHLRPTTPIRNPQLIDKAIDSLFSMPEATSLRSGHEAPETIFKWFTRDEAGYFHGLLKDYSRPEYYNLPRQALPSVYIPNGYVDILRSDFVLNSGGLHGSHILGFITPAVREIDTFEDFQYLEYEMNKKGHMLRDYLVKHYGRVS